MGPVVDGVGTVSSCLMNFGVPPLLGGNAPPTLGVTVKDGGRAGEKRVGEGLRSSECVGCFRTENGSEEESSFAVPVEGGHFKSALAVGAGMGREA